ncbi:hemolysin family protein [Bifidobacterium magnum]|uniref:Co2+ resistance protein, CorC n=1 Tax=Bifidobacterium magnum TaxID=1692 RepID=A0A087B6B6_9BIFI|nr:hemolysin family protein [Bifidobacterium magnum]KFI66566.1 Co2+ resistance protein, CorC [Bifidobacterium magnum]
MDETMIITLSVVMAVAAVLLAAVSMLMAGLEGAIVRVTRANVNNAMIDLQTDGELSHFSRMKLVGRMHRVQRLLANRHAASAACSFMRITCNVLIGALVACITGLFSFPWWCSLIAGLVAALLMAAVSMVVRPRDAHSMEPLEFLLKHVSLAMTAFYMVPVARGERNQNKRAELSDDEALEKLQQDQGKAALERMIETNRFDPEVSEMLRSIMLLSDTLTREIMVPRTDMICIEQTETLGDFLRLCSRSGFSRVPVIGSDVDDLVGIAYLKDAVRATSYNPKALDRCVQSIVRTAMLVPESKPVDDLFHEMQVTRHHVAMVVDEYGGIAGMVTIEDAIEQIVGELEDEHDRKQHEEPEQLEDGSWSMPARTPIADLEEIFALNIEEDDVDTVYGLLTKILGRVPIVGSSAVTHGLKLTAVDSAGRRKKVSTIVVERVPVESNEETGKQQKQPAGDGTEQKDEEDE